MVVVVVLLTLQICIFLLTDFDGSLCGEAKQRLSFTFHPEKITFMTEYGLKNNKAEEEEEEESPGLAPSTAALRDKHGD